MSCFYILFCAQGASLISGRKLVWENSANSWRMIAGGGKIQHSSTAKVPHWWVCVGAWVCVCVGAWVCVREREREKRQKEGWTEISGQSSTFLSLVAMFPQISTSRMLSGPLNTLTTSEAVRWSHNTPAFLTFGSGALVVTCSLNLKSFDQGLWTLELFSATVFWLKGHMLSLSSSYYASFSGHVCSTPSSSIRKRCPGRCQMQKDRT